MIPKEDEDDPSNADKAYDVARKAQSFGCGLTSLGCCVFIVACFAFFLWLIGAAMIKSTGL
jgi:hypothetical protein